MLSTQLRKIGDKELLNGEKIRKFLFFNSYVVFSQIC